MHPTILLVDHNSLLRQGLRSLLDSQGDFEVIAEARDGREALHRAIANPPDLVLMDSQLPGMDGLQTAAQIKRRLPDVRLIMLTETKTSDFLRESLQVGADSFVLKDATFEELLSALHSVVRGKKYFSPDVSPLPVEGYLNPHLTANVEQDSLRRLTMRERSILQLVAEGRTNRATAEFLSVSPKTVEKHRANLMRKLGLRNATDLMFAAVELGVVERPAFQRHRQPAVRLERGRRAV
jgi:DNA-binding NarL/FixJ family response regulator